MFNKIAERFSYLDYYLKVSRIKMSPALYVRKSFYSALILSLIIFLFLALIEYFTVGTLVLSIWLFFVLLPFLVYFYLNIPRYNEIKANKLIETEIVSVTRFLALEIKSERSIYNALENTSSNFAIIGIYIDEILNDVKLGKTLESSMEQAIEYCPNANMRNLLWRLLNSLRTGADITGSLENLIEDIEEDQRIRIEDYGRELNALSLFYMMISIIIPTIGFTIVSTVLTFVGINITLGFLIGLWLFLTMIQVIFLRFAMNRRPDVEGY